MAKSIDQKLDIIIDNVGSMRTDLAVIRNDIDHMEVAIGDVQSVHKSVSSTISTIQVNGSAMGADIDNMKDKIGYNDWLLGGIIVAIVGSGWVFNRTKK